MLALEGYAALCTVKISSRSIPSLFGIFPFEESGDDPKRLILFTLPFCDDVKVFNKPTFHDVLEEDEEEDDEEDENVPLSQKAQAADALIDAFMLPNDAICSERIASPFHTSFYKTVLRRAVKRKEPNENDLIAVREHLDPMKTPQEVVERAKVPLEKFHELFPLKEKKVVKKQGRGKAGTTTGTTYADHL